MTAHHDCLRNVAVPDEFAGGLIANDDAPNRHVWVARPPGVESALKLGVDIGAQTLPVETGFFF